MENEEEKTKGKDERDQCEELEKKVLDLENKWKRALADYQNLEKRTAEESKSVLDFASEAILYDLLPVLDSLEDATLHIKDEGLNLCLKKFKDFLESYDVEEIKVDGTDFDADTMEAIGSEKGEENKVVKVHKKGYMLSLIHISEPTRPY